MSSVLSQVPPAANAAAAQSSAVRWALASLSLSMLLSSLGTSIANVGLPSLMQAFDASFQQVQWIVLAYLLAITTLAVSVGRLGDRIGRRRLLLGGIALFTLASAACAVMPGLAALIAARAVQGLGAAVMMTLTVAFVGETVPKARTGSAMGLLGTMSAVGTALGPSLGGLLIAAAGWRAIFAIMLPLGLLTYGLARRHLPQDTLAPKASSLAPKASGGGSGFDIAGSLLLAATLGAYALAMTIGQGRPGPLNLGLLVAAGVGIVWFIRVERRAPSPLVRPAMLRDPVLSAGLAASLLVSAVVMATLVVGPFFLSRALGLDTAAVGLVLSGGPVMAALAGIPAGRLADRLGAPPMQALGLAVVVVGTLALSLLPSLTGVPGYLAAITTVTIGYVLFQAANNMIVMAGAGPERRGLVSGMLSLSRFLGLITGASLMGALFAWASAGPADPAAGAIRGLAVTFQVAAGLALAALIVTVLAGRRGKQLI